MPGVPSSGSCDACLKQKKKCDLGTPACGRCQRLRIACTGARARRYKFLSVNGKRESGHTHLVVSSASGAFTAPGMPLTNASTKLVDQFLHKLYADDIRFDVSFTYGPLLSELPKRLGQNDVLDASVAAFITTLGDLGSGTHSRERTRMYGRALAKLRNALQVSEKALCPLTLCAVYLLWICQSWEGGDQSSSRGHGAGVVHILSQSPLRYSTELFDQQLLYTILAPVVFEAALGPTLKLEGWMQRVILGPSSKPVTMAACLLQLPLFTTYDPRLALVISRYYGSILEQYFAAEAAHQQVCSKENGVSLHVQATAFSSLGLLSGVAIVLNGILRVYHPSDEELCTRSSLLCARMIDLASQCEPFLPLAAGWIPVSLELAWIVRDDAETRMQLQSTWEKTWGRASNTLFRLSRSYSSMFEKLKQDAAADRLLATSAIAEV